MRDFLISNYLGVPALKKILQKFQITHRRQDGNTAFSEGDFRYWRVANGRGPIPPIPRQKEVIPSLIGGWMEFLDQVWQTNILLVVLCGIQVLILLEMYARAKRGKCTRDSHGSEWERLWSLVGGSSEETIGHTISVWLLTQGVVGGHWWEYSVVKPDDEMALREGMNILGTALN